MTTESPRSHDGLTAPADKHRRDESRAGDIRRGEARRDARQGRASAIVVGPLRFGRASSR